MSAHRRQPVGSCWRWPYRLWGVPAAASAGRGPRAARARGRAHPAGLEVSVRAAIGLYALVVSACVAGASANRRRNPMPRSCSSQAGRGVPQRSRPAAAPRDVTWRSPL